MSIIKKKIKAAPNDDEIRSDRVKDAMSTMAENMINLWNSGWDSIWDAPDPATVLAELGTEAGEVFALNEDVIALFGSSLTGRRQEDLDAITAKVLAKPATTTHPDGTVTIDPV